MKSSLQHSLAALLLLMLLAAISVATAEAPPSDDEYEIVSEAIELDAPELEEFLLEGLDDGADRVLEDGSGDEQAVSASTGIAINAKAFPDSVFRDYVSANFDTNGDGILSADECAAVTEITVYRKAIASLKGIEYFQNLDFLGCSSCLLTALDVSRLSKLTVLQCDQNQLKKLDVRSNPKLKVLHCMNNQLKTLDVSKNPELEYLLAYSNHLTKLDVSKNAKLVWLFVSSNDLTKLNVKSNPALKELDCSDNQLTKLDLSKNPKLKYLACRFNQLTSLDLSHNPALKELSCETNQLTSLDLSHNPALKELRCETNQLTSLDLSHNPALKELSCETNRLEKLDLRKNRKLEVLYCGDNDIDAWYGFDGKPHNSLYIDKCTALKELSCMYCALGSLDLSYNTALETLICSCCDLEELNIANCRALKELVCDNNRISSPKMRIGDHILYLGEKPALERLECYKNGGICVLNISQCPKLLAAYKKGTTRKDSDLEFLEHSYGNTLLCVDPDIMIDTNPEPDNYCVMFRNDTGEADAGDIIQIVAAYKKIKSCTSSNKKVASVTASGKVTARAAGKVKIKVTLTNKKKLTLTLTVRNPKAPTKVKIKQGKSATVKKGETLNLTAVLLPKGASSRLSWKSSEKKIATVDQKGVVHGLKRGTARITVTTKNKKQAVIKIRVK